MFSFVTFELNMDQETQMTDNDKDSNANAYNSIKEDVLRNDSTSLDEEVRDNDNIGVPSTSAEIPDFDDNYINPSNTEIPDFDGSYVNPSDAGIRDFDDVCVIPSNTEISDFGKNIKINVTRLKRYIFGLIAAYGIGGIIFIVVISVLFGKLEGQPGVIRPGFEENLTKLLEKEELCIPCDKLQMDTFELKKTQGIGECCIQSTSQLLDVLDYFIGRRVRDEVDRGIVYIKRKKETERPAAHLVGESGKFDEAYHEKSAELPVPSWKYNFDLAFIDHVIYRAGRIVVPSAGLYFVYSQIAFTEAFKHKHSSRDVMSSNKILHSIYRYNIIDYEEKLIQSSVSKLVGRNKRFGVYTSYLGALFHLRAGDEIFVKVSNLTWMVRDPKLNYFGLFRL